MRTSPILGQPGFIRAKARPVAPVDVETSTDDGHPASRGTRSLWQSFQLVAACHGVSAWLVLSAVGAYQHFRYGDERAHAPLGLAAWALVVGVLPGVLGLILVLPGLVRGWGDADRGDRRRMLDELTVAVCAVAAIILVLFLGGHVGYVLLEPELLAAR